jgi:GH24 family phage-related lysozyme (muramidase)
MNPDSIIRAIQTFVGVKPDGSPGQITWKAIYVKLTGKAWADLQPATDPIIRAVQTFVGVEPDGSPGQITWKAIYAKLTGKTRVEAEPAPAYAKLRGKTRVDAEPAPAPDAPGIEGFPQHAISMILEAEGIDQPAKWPGGGSGMTLGYGCDIGADPKSLDYWRGVLTDDQIKRLAVAKGKIGNAAAAIARHFSDIKVSMDDALRVFMKHTLPSEIALTRKTYPGIDLLPPTVLGAMTSIVYNRGPGLEGDRRAEMREIRDVITQFVNTPPERRDVKATLEKIAGLIQRMKRHWGNDQRGLLIRRDAEAKLIRDTQIS